jgi:hypothetical protein
VKEREKEGGQSCFLLQRVITLSKVRALPAIIYVIDAAAKLA